MVLKVSYRTIVTNLDVGTKFLTENSAYFLGLLMADEQIALNKEVYWIAPVRHNPKQYDDINLEEHYNNVKILADAINKKDLTHFISYYKNYGVKFKKFNAGKNGFVTLFKQLTEQYTLDDLINDIHNSLKHSSNSVKRAFLVGTFDGRSSYDKTYKFISQDIDNNTLINLLSDTLNSLGVDAKINNSLNSRKRDNPKSKPRKGQIRIKYLDFLSMIGFISPIRYAKATSEVPRENLEKHDEILQGLKTVRLKGE